MTEQKDIDWIDKELASLALPLTFGERLPSLKLEEKKLTEFDVDFSQPFQKWNGQDGIIKAIVNVTHNKEKKVLWLNIKNPLYHKIIELGKKGQTHFKVIRTGSLKDTRYELID